MIYVTLIAMYIALCAVTTVFYPAIKLAKSLGVNNTYTRNVGVSISVLWVLTVFIFPAILLLLLSRESLNGAITAIEDTILEDDGDVIKK